MNHQKALFPTLSSSEQIKTEHKRKSSKTASSRCWTNMASHEFGSQWQNHINYTSSKRSGRQETSPPKACSATARSHV
eukprot:2576126-Amphidinium_carterae.1